MPENVSTAHPPDGHGRRWRGLLPAGTFLAGLALGGALVAVGVVGGDDAAVPPRASPGPERDAAQERDDRPGSGTADAGDRSQHVRVPDSCVRTADDATTLVEHVDRVVAAVAELEPERLRQTVDEVQQVRDRVAGVAEQCRQQAALRVQGAASTEPTPVS